MGQGKNQKHERGPKMTPEDEAFIADVYNQHPRWKAPEIRNWVIAELHKHNPNLCRKYPDWPSLSTVQKTLAGIRKEANKPNPQDKPWCIGMLTDCPIPPEAMPTVLRVWKFRVAREEGFTVREAKWVAYLSALITDVEELSSEADRYARFEFIYELAGYSTFDSTHLDKHIMGIPVETAVAIVGDGQEAGVTLIPNLDIFHRLFPYHIGPDGNPVHTEVILRVPKKMVEKIKTALLEMERQWEDYKKEVQNEG